MRSKRLYLLSCLLTIFLILFSASNRASEMTPMDVESLSKQLASQDANFFAAFNRCDLATMAAYMADDFEFYHDLGGLTDSKSKMLNMERERCGGDRDVLRRERIEGSLETFPLKGYGALQHGEHRFYLTAKGQPEKLIEVAKFTSVWQRTGDKWQMTRVISYDHQAPDTN